MTSALLAIVLLGGTIVPMNKVFVEIGEIHYRHAGNDYTGNTHTPLGNRAVNGSLSLGFSGQAMYRVFPLERPVYYCVVFDGDTLRWLAGWAPCGLPKQP